MQMDIKQGLAMLICNTEDLVVIDLVCVFLEASLTALYYLLPHIQSVYPTNESALCS